MIRELYPIILIIRPTNKKIKFLYLENVIKKRDNTFWC